MLSTDESRASGDQAHPEPPWIRLCGDIFCHPGRIYPFVTLLDHHGISKHRCEDNLLVSAKKNPALTPKLDFDQRFKGILDCDMRSYSRVDLDSTKV
jgi:hypothetical protein